MSNIYSSKFLVAGRAILAAACADGARITREELSDRLEEAGFAVSPTLLKVAVEEGAFNTPKQAFALFTGRYGGIRELDLEATAAFEAAQLARHEKVMARINKANATRAANKNKLLAAVAQTTASV